MANPLPIVRPLDGWLALRIANTIQDDRVRYEASLYGPLNGLLGHVFPLQRTFMVKPQAKLRPTLGPPPVNPPQGVRVSTDSMNNQVASRTTVVGRRREVVDEPDFVVVKSGPNYGDDMALAIIEVKRDDEPLLADLDQIQRYMQSIFSKGPANDLRGYLVTKGTTYVFDLPASANVDAVCSAELHTATQLKASLETLAQAHW
jgi:hypothetical protein